MLEKTFSAFSSFTPNLAFRKDIVPTQSPSFLPNFPSICFLLGNTLSCVNFNLPLQGGKRDQERMLNLMSEEIIAVCKDDFVMEIRHTIYFRHSCWLNEFYIFYNIKYSIVTVNCNLSTEYEGTICCFHLLGIKTF